MNPNSKRNKILDKFKEIETLKSKGPSVTSILQDKLLDKSILTLISSLTKTAESVREQKVNKKTCTKGTK